jgi:hypothetical protein
VQKYFRSDNNLRLTNIKDPEIPVPEALLQSTASKKNSWLRAIGRSYWPN